MREFFNIIEKIFTILFTISTYIVMTFLMLMLIFDKAKLNEFSTNELIIICTLVCMGFVTTNKNG